MIRADVWATGDALLGEAPRLIAPVPGVEPVLRWTDLLQGEVLERGARGAAVRVRGFEGETVSALIPLAAGRLAVALRRRILVLEADGETEVAEIAPGLPPGMRLSDAIAGPGGHVWVGVVDEQLHGAPGSLMRVGPGAGTLVRDGIGFANGVGFSADGRRLFHVDSTAGTVVAIEHDPRTGRTGDAQIVFRHSADGELDGLAVDAHDRLWIAVFGGGRVLCVGTRGADAGRVLDTVTVPVSRVTSCCFGADDSLYITTARIGALADELAREPLAGSVFRARVGSLGGPRHEGNLLV
ncbi:SMP-30/gluconolactonase/LRE family protein [Microbacterium sp. 18062]|uniref:SMP-30/gluconolactonase/LRE family protein n=1 Tax=Microbacterium sp. 18062 TaxID=2681410 RepID=UPI00135B4078|nr:SMP-30/gluconolactonase/LRE family protein [Microbacterium sp. 18062]